MGADAGVWRWGPITGGTGVSERTERPARAVARRLLIDLAPLRRSRDLRCLVLGELISVLGTQLTTVPCSMRTCSMRTCSMRT
jgi:hypothetical protein